MIKYEKGDLLDREKFKFNAIVHGCNCFHTMKSGVAGQIAERYPEAIEADKMTEFGDKKKLGSISVGAVELGDDPYLIINAYTQFEYGTGKVHLDYEALEAAREQINEVFKPEDYTLGFPQIGCGLAGGDWDKVEEIMNKVFKDREITVVIYEP